MQKIILREMGFNTCEVRFNAENSETIFNLQEIQVMLDESRVVKSHCA